MTTDPAADHRAERRHAALEVLAEVSGVDPDSLEARTELVSQLGIDSPKALHLLVELEDRLGIEIDDDAIVKLKTVGDILEAIDRLDSGDSGAAGGSG